MLSPSFYYLTESPSPSHLGWIVATCFSVVAVAAGGGVAIHLFCLWRKKRQRNNKNNERQPEVA